MKVLVIGNGGREHALVWKISKSPLVTKIYCAPGNAGTGQIAENIPISADHIPELATFAQDNKIDLTVTGPEISLVLGISDEFQKRGLRIFGVSQKAAELEKSKAFSKSFFKKYNIPTAAFEVFNTPDAAKHYIHSTKKPIVIKADGLAAGKGVYICQTDDEAIFAIDEIMKEKKFGAAGNRVVIEDFLQGIEASYIVITDGNTILPLATSQDHKQIHDGDKGPNTGGMGAYSPAPVITESLEKEIMETIIYPAVTGMKQENRLYQGVLYAGIMIVNNKPYVLEFNVRFGDPETQPILLRMKSDIIPLFESVLDSSLHTCAIEWTNQSATCVIMSSEGYPGNYCKGEKIVGLTSYSDDDSVMIFHSGTSQQGDTILTNGGRVLGVTALGDSITLSNTNAYEAISKVSFKGAYYRKDIGEKGEINS